MIQELPSLIFLTVIFAGRNLHYTHRIKGGMCFTTTLVETYSNLLSRENSQEIKQAKCSKKAPL